MIQLLPLAPLHLMGAPIQIGDYAREQIHWFHWSNVPGKNEMHG